MQLQSDSCPMEPITMIYTYIRIATVGSTIQTVNSPIPIWVLRQRSEDKNHKEQHTDSTKFRVPGWDPTYNALVSTLLSSHPASQAWTDTRLAWEDRRLTVLSNWIFSIDSQAFFFDDFTSPVNFRTHCSSDKLSINIFRNGIANWN